MTLPEKWKDHFPQTHHMAVGWKPYTRYIALHQHVLCAATTRMEGSWCAYCREVPGICHRSEVHHVLDTGDKLPEDLARAMFPELEGVPYAS